MTKNFPLISIIIATYNSSKTLFLTLDSIRKQTYPQKKIEVLIVDGGSKDKTLELAIKYGCRIINNPKVEPVNARLLGYKNAKGKYIVFIDADEVLSNSKSLVLKYKSFESDKNVKAAIFSGYADPNGSNFLRSYINEFGDPFSFFYYRSSKSYKLFVREMMKKYPILSEKKDFIVCEFLASDQPVLMELGAAGSMVDLSYLRTQFPKFNAEVFAHLFQLLVSKGARISITKNDPLIHYSSDNLSGYISKLKWRIKNNIFYKTEMGISGFSGREKYQPKIYKLRKYFFLLYAFTILPILIDSLYLSISRKRLVYLLHFPLVLYTAILIVYYYVAKILGEKPLLKNYDETAVIRKIA